MNFSSSTLYPQWKAIQPFRDWVMARTVVKKLDSLDQNVVPVVAAAAGTHLPLVRKFLCDAGIETVTVAPSPLWKPPSSWYGTSPIMDFLTSTNLASPKPYKGSLQRSTEPGISQMLDTWITDSGLF